LRETEIKFQTLKPTFIKFQWLKRNKRGTVLSTFFSVKGIFFSLFYGMNIYYDLMFLANDPKKSSHSLQNPIVEHFLLAGMIKVLNFSIFFIF